MYTAVVAIIVFSALVFFHELGHFSIAKLVGIKVHEFAIGMGPKLLGFRKGETDYSVRALPIGGYVRMEGEDEKSNDARSFSNKSIKERIAVILAGPLMNIILGLILFTIIFYNVAGVPTTRIEQIIANTPAEEIGMEAGDRIVSINGRTIESWDQIVEQISTSNGESLNLEIERNNIIVQKTIDPEVDSETGQFRIGIVPSVQKSFSLAIKNSFSQTRMIVFGIFDFFRGLISSRQEVLEDVVGPVGIINLVGQASRAGMIYVMHLAALISINLAVMNLLPIPALDGSRILFLIIEALRGKPIDPDKEGFVHIVGFALLMLLMIMITYKDITSIFF
ncbi:RIP metalloprotease RseP [Serpentinicella alkaliphila]|uniref:Zinc metalloprotease n=1 Tax=Serpentinicella alkaliphila TaxID=1734049 RepID=A0A4R2TPZ3_9FIRM|nr:RIP metalloprotease RseP [Serpentinicella alkaliphila]QUH26320.1 RIP metalloprotease RseP [Serpentinicella alkaliphila]TCQ05900.1 regulator of sigma E protease [Serpentinicella alkaliphila]